MTDLVTFPKLPPEPLNLDPKASEAFWRAAILRLYRAAWMHEFNLPFSADGIARLEQQTGLNAKAIAKLVHGAEWDRLFAAMRRQADAENKLYKAQHPGGFNLGTWIVQHDPIAALVEAAAKGEPIDQAFKEAGDAVVKNLQDVGPYVQTAISFVPGFGTAAAAAIGGAVALAKGEPIADALVDAFGGALPGGIVSQMALRAGITAIQDAAEGKSLDQIGLDAAREAIPAGPARMAFDAGVAIMGAALSQRSPQAAHVIAQGAAAAGAPNAHLPPPRHLPTPAQVRAYGAAAELARAAHAPPPAPPVPPAKGTPVPVFGPAVVQSANNGPASDVALAAVIGVAIVALAKWHKATQ